MKLESLLFMLVTFTIIAFITVSLFLKVLKNNKSANNNLQEDE